MRACVASLFVCLLVAACGGADSAPDESATGADATAGRDSDEIVWRDEARGLSVAVPAGWQRATEPLTPHLGDPVEVLALGTYPLRPGGDRCAHQPVNAVEELGPDDALLVLFERAPPFGPHGYPPRPATLSLETGTNRFCVPATGRADAWFSFGESGRAFYVLAAVGETASAATRAQLDAIYASLAFESR